MFSNKMVFMLNNVNGLAKQGLGSRLQLRSKRCIAGVIFILQKMGLRKFDQNKPGSWTIRSHSNT